MTKGRVTRALVAPTYFMISISRRRAKTLSRMVVPTVMMLTAISTSTTIRPALVTAFWTSTKAVSYTHLDVYKRQCPDRKRRRKLERIYLRTPD